jgi:hypothetical protein
MMLGDTSTQRPFARRVLQELRNPARPTAPAEPPEAIGIEAAWRRRQEKCAVELLREEGFDPADLLRPPRALDASCRSYCPRCEAQFVKPEGECRDCGGLPLAPLHPAPE